MSVLRDSLKKLSFFTHYPKNHETLTINNVTEEYYSKSEKWNELFSSYYFKGKWYLNEPLSVLKFTGTNFESSYGNFSNSLIILDNDAMDSPNELYYSYMDDTEHTIKIINAPYSTAHCFDGCTNLTSIKIASNVTTLGAYCFYNCSNLTDVTLPPNLTTINSDCFSFCSLEKINIPSTVTSIGSNCFYDCRRLGKIFLNWTNSNQIITYNSTWIYRVSSYGSANVKFIIPNGTTSLYEAKGYPSDKLQER